jgi:hypothetical protein
MLAHPQFAKYTITVRHGNLIQPYPCKASVARQGCFRAVPPERLGGAAAFQMRLRAWTASFM